jgi:hypothetical protein
MAKEVTMDTRTALQTCVLATVFGFLGAVSTRLLFAPPVFAQNSSVITAQEFRVVDEAGRLRGVLSTKSASGWVQLELKSQEGLPRMALNVNQRGEAFVLMYDRSNSGSYSTSFRMPSVNLIGPDGSIRASLQ